MSNNDKKNDKNEKHDSDDDDDDDSVLESSMHHFANQKAVGGSNSISNYLVTSWRAVESAALHIPEQHQQHHGGGGGRHGGQAAIYSRLGGTGGGGGGSLRGSMRMTASPKLRASIHEKTSLLEAQTKQGKDYNDEEGADDASGPPSLMRWFWIALLCALAYALYNICIKKGSASIHPILGGVILQFVAATMGAILLTCMIWDPTKDAANTDKIRIERLGVYWSIGAGLWVGIAEITSFIVSGMGVPATQFIPINIGGSVVFGAILGVFLLGETVMLHGWSGVVMLIAGIAMVATDPGEKVTEGGGVEESAETDDDNDNDSPPLLVWMGPALFCALAYALYNICIKKGSAYVNPIVGAVILQFVAALLGTLMLVIECWIVTGTMPEATQQGIVWACLAGIFVGAAELLSFCVSGMGVPATQSIPIIIGGSVMFGAVLGIIMLGEELMGQGWMGVIVLMVGIGFVATDPGEKVEGH